MSNELTPFTTPASITAIPPADELREAWKLADALCKTGFFPKSVDTTAKAVAIYLKGRELGIPFMQAMSSIHIVEGRPGVSAELMRALCAQRVKGFNVKVLEHTAEVCRMEFRRDGYEPFVYEYTMKDAQRACLETKQNWKANPKPMLAARCSSQGLRLYCPDALMGVQSIDEIEDGGTTQADHETTKAAIDRALGGPAPPDSGATVVGEGEASGATTDSSATAKPADDVAAPEPTTDPEPSPVDYAAETRAILEGIYGPKTFAGRGGASKLASARKELVTWGTRNGLAPAVIDEKAIYGMAMAYKAGEAPTEAATEGTEPPPASTVASGEDHEPAGASESEPGAAFSPEAFLARCREAQKLYGETRTFLSEFQGTWWFVDKPILDALGSSDALPINDDTEVHPLLAAALPLVVAAKAEMQRNARPTPRGPSPI